MIYWYTVAYLESLSGDARAARAALRRVLSLPGSESRAILLTWKLLRDLGEEPSQREALRVYGVVFELADKVEEQYTVLAGYADGQLRWLRLPGPSLIGENWTESERKAAKQLVALGQVALSQVAPLQSGRNLPAPGAAHVYLLTPGGTYRAKGTVEELADKNHPLHDLFGSAWRVHLLAFWLAGMATRQLSTLQQAEALMDAVRRSDCTRAKQFLGFGASRNARVDGETVLATAASRQDIEIVRLLVSRGADVNAKVTNTEGLKEAPVLLLPAGNGASNILKLLLESGADVDSTDALETTALMCASYLGHVENVRILIGHGAQIDAKDASGYSALMYAANAGHTDCVSTLLRAGADVNARDKDGNTPVAFAAQHGSSEVVNLLIARGADPSAQGSHGLSAADLAEQNGHRRVASILKRAARAQAYE